jgi:ABC-2 type transport system permease protein
MAYFVFQEHIGNTWDRLRAANVPGWALTTGFSAPWFVMTILYQIVLFGVGVLFMDLRLDGIWVQTLVVMVCLAALYEGITVLLLSFVSSLRNFQALVYVGGIALGSFGGALVPVTNLPSWIQSIAPAIPSYWAMRAFNSLLLDRESYGALVLPCSILLACAAVSFTIGSARFNAEKRKLS